MTEHLTPASQEHSSRRHPKRKAVRIFAFLVFASLVTGLITTGYLYYKTKQELRRLSTPEGRQEVTQQEINAVVSRLGKLTLLPDEPPVIATIVNSKYLATQSAFYQKAENGDKLVVYQKSQRAYIYSPAKNIIINSGPLVIDPKAAQAASQGTNQTPGDAAQQQVKDLQKNLKVELRNGTSVVGQATKMKQQIEGNGVEVSAVTDASKKDYAKTTVYAVSKDVTTELLQALAAKVGGEVVAAAPAGEAVSTADVVIIAGK